LDVKTAIVTLAIGDTYLERWRRLCEPGWRAYAEKCGYDLLVIDQPLDVTARAAARSPSWQKCLVLQSSITGRYGRVVWIDADILINAAAPPITEGVPIEAIGITDEHTYPTPELRLRIINHLTHAWMEVDPKVGRNWETFLDPAAWHALAGLPRRGRYMIQPGVMVLSPRHHHELLEYIYYRYEDQGGDQMNYEMRPFSFEVQERNLQHWIDARFNALVSMLIWKRQMELNRLITAEECSSLLAWEYRQNYFLHFAGRHDLMMAARPF